MVYVYTMLNFPRWDDTFEGYWSNLKKPSGFFYFINKLAIILQN